MFHLPSQLQTVWCIDPLEEYITFQIRRSGLIRDRLDCYHAEWWITITSIPHNITFLHLTTHNKYNWLMWT